MIDPYPTEGNYNMQKPLKNIAADMYSDVRNGIQKSRITLSHGLALSLSQTDRIYTLTCGRRSTLPSQTELKVIAGAFDLLFPEWQQFDVQEWRCYKYTWTYVDINNIQP